MTKKRTSTQSSRQKNKNIGLVFILISLFLLLSFISHLFAWRQDQDQILLAKSSFKYLFSDQKAQNLIGRLGAVISHLFFYHGIGVFSFIPVVFLGFYGWRNYKNFSKPKLGNFLFALSSILLFLCPLFAFVFQKFEFPFGGGYGRMVVDVLESIIGNIGTGILLLITFLLFLNFSNAKIWDYLFNFIPKIGSDVKYRFFTSLKSAQNRIFEPTFVNTETNDSSEVSNENLKVDENDTKSPSKAELQIDESIADQRINLQDLHIEVPKYEKSLQSIHDDFIILNTTEDKVISELYSEEDLLAIVDNEDKQETHIAPILDNIEADDDIELPSSNLLSVADLPTFEGINFELPKNTKQLEPIGVNFPNEGEKIKVTIPQEEEELNVTDFVSDVHTSLNIPYDPRADLSHYKYPTLELLEQRKSEQVQFDKNLLKENIDQITNTLNSFNINIVLEKTTATIGPTVTLYEIVPDKGVRISKIKNLEDDIALNLAALGIRIIAPIPGKGTIGIEVPNENRQLVGLRSILASEKFVNTKFHLPLALGKKIDNQNMIIDLASLPHLLMAGATGQGKSVGINTILISLLYKMHPSQLKFVLIDPKKVELSVYRLIEKHFLAKLPDEEESIITDTKKVINTLNALCIEMDSRYDLLKQAGARNITEYNEKFINRKLNPKNGHKFLPFIVLVIDEFADLIMTAGKEVEVPIARLAQLARAVGVHLIVATQRPDAKVITGTIKANFPARIAFKVSSQIDSRTILDSKGAEQLIGKGDMLLSANGEVTRVQCAFLDTPEVERIVEFISQQQGYPIVYELPEYIPEGNEDVTFDKDILEKRDMLFEDAARMVIANNSGSTSMLQRKFNLGYNRAGRIMDQLEAAGIVGPSCGGKPREVLISTEYELEQILNNL